METVKLAPDLEVSRVAWGLWRWADWGMPVEALHSRLQEVLDLGITLIDHADIYADGDAEKAFGEVLGKDPALRERMQLISKSTIVYPRGDVRVKYYDTSKKHIIDQAEKSLENLQTDYLDLLLLHRPDPLMDPAEVAAAFEKLREDGKVRHFGVSNYKRTSFEMLQSYMDVPLVTNQIEASVLAHENFDDLTIQFLQKQRVHPIIWSPLAGGRIFVGEDDASIRVRAVLEEIRDEIGAPNIDSVALAWLYTHPVGAITITGADNLEFIRRPIEALEYRLTPEQWFMIWTAATGRKIL